jgi:hypothetical protein
LGSAALPLRPRKARAIRRSRFAALPRGGPSASVGRSVAQPGSALASGARGREFESPRSDQWFQELSFPANILRPGNAQETARGRSYPTRAAARAADVVGANRRNDRHSSRTRAAACLDCPVSTRPHENRDQSARGSFLSSLHILWISNVELVVRVAGAIQDDLDAHLRAPLLLTKSPEYYGI